MRTLLLLCLAGAACASPTDPWSRELGILLVTGDSARVNLPVEATIGEPFPVELTTIGLSGCYRSFATHVEQDANTVTITPWDIAVGNACTDVLVDLAHEVVVTFAEPGTATVIIRGRDLRGGARQVIEPAFHITVR